MTTPSTAVAPAQQTPYTAPRNSMEQALAVIWSETLKIDIGTIGIHNSLMELGGAHSLLVIQIIGRITDQFNVELPLAEVLTQPTINQLAALIADLRSEKPTG
jgi:acyl carrier protein